MRIAFCIVVLVGSIDAISAKYEPTWQSIDSRPLPAWYDEAKVGIFLTWGVFSVPSFGSEWFWHYWRNTKVPKYVNFMKDQYPPNWTYQDFARDFDAYLFDPTWWAQLIKDSGAKYVVLITKHHEGFTLWPSNVSFSWNSIDVGPKRDLVGELASAVRSVGGVKFGVYHSMFEWFNPLLEVDRENNMRTNYFPRLKTIPEMYELVNTYKPDIFWSDGDEGPSPDYWNSTGFLAWLYNDSPVKDTVVVNDRWGEGAMCHHGGFWTCDDRYNPGTVVQHKWENCFTLDVSSWGYRREAVLADYLSELNVITTLAQTISCGGNILLNTGPRKDGRIDPLMEERLRQLGQWLRINGEAVYGTKPWLFQHDLNGSVWYTAKQNGAGAVHVFAILLQWPKFDVVQLSSVKSSRNTQITMLGLSSQSLPWKEADDGIGIHIDLSSILFADIPSTVAWVLKIENPARSQQKFHPTVLANYNFQ